MSHVLLAIMPQAGATGTTGITIPFPPKTSNVKQLGKRGLKDNVHLAEIINVTKLQPVLEEDVAVSANALIIQLYIKTMPVEWWDQAGKAGKHTMR
jgi:hypothetical protein